MKLKTVRIVELLLLGVVVALTMLGLVLQGKAATVTVCLALAAAVGHLGFVLRFRRCPGCGGLLWMRSAYCPHCAARLDW